MRYFYTSYIISISDFERLQNIKSQLKSSAGEFEQAIKKKLLILTFSNISSKLNNLNLYLNLNLLNF